MVLGALVWLATLAVVIGSLLDRETGTRSFDATPLPESECSGPELGVHSTLAWEGDAERRSATVAATSEFLDPQVVRDSLLWHQIEPVEGERDWSRLDSVVEELRDDGIEPLLTILGSPSWANGVSATTPDHYLYVPPRGPELDAWLDRYADFVAAAVERYKRYVRRWEIWNEPNLAHFWRPRPDPLAYREVYEVLRATILRVDPGAEVAVGGVTDLTTASAPDIRGLDFLRLLTRTRPPLDNVAIHPYPTDGHPPNVHIPGENNFDDIEVVRDQLAAEGERPSIWVTEWGWSSTAVGEAAQARYVDESLTMLETRFSFVRVATYFADYDRPPEFFQGLLNADLDPKPAAAAFRRHADLAASRCTTPAG